MTEAGVPSASATSSGPTTAASTAPTGSTSPSILSAGHARRVENPSQDGEEDNAKDIGSPVRPFVIVTTAATATATSLAQIRIPPLALVRESEAVLDAAAAAEDVWVVGVGVAFAHDVRGPELELLGQGGGAGPLDVFGAVAGAVVGAAHDVDGVEVAEGRVGEALELGRGGDAAVGCRCAAAAEGEGLDFGEEDCVFGGGFGGGGGEACHAYDERV